MDLSGDCSVRRGEEHLLICGGLVVMAVPHQGNPAVAVGDLKFLSSHVFCPFTYDDDDDRIFQEESSCVLLSGPHSASVCVITCVCVCV